MPFIQNVSMSDIKTGLHPKAAVLIQIVDPAFGFPTPVYPFSEIHRFEFLDAEDDCRFEEEAKFSDVEAAAIVSIMREALEHDKNVIVHCHMGLCRSGAVAEVGVMMGFNDTHKIRQPNCRVKTKLINALGWGYSNS